jgi:urease accessory protein
VTAVELAGSAEVDVLEQVVLGRHGEAGGSWSGRLVADRDGRPVLRTTQGSEAVATAPVPGGGPARAIVTRLLAGAVPGTAWTRGGAVCCPLAAAGVVLVTSLGSDLTRAAADAGVHAAADVVG